VIKLDKSATWAKRALASKRSAPGKKSSQVGRKSSPGRRFWRKGES